MDVKQGHRDFFNEPFKLLLSYFSHTALIEIQEEEEEETMIIFTHLFRNTNIHSQTPTKL